MFLGEPAVHLSQFFFPLLPLTEVSSRPSAIPGGNPPGDGQSTVGWGDAGFEPGTAGQQSGELPLSHHASHIEPPRLPSRIISIMGFCRRLHIWSAYIANSQRFVACAHSTPKFNLLAIENHMCLKVLHSGACVGLNQETKQDLRNLVSESL
jgi:hypothetical protein